MIINWEIEQLFIGNRWNCTVRLLPIRKILSLCVSIVVFIYDCWGFCGKYGLRDISRKSIFALHSQTKEWANYKYRPLLPSIFNSLLCPKPDLIPLDQGHGRRPHGAKPSPTKLSNMQVDDTLIFTGSWCSFTPAKRVNHKTGTDKEHAPLFHHMHVQVNFRANSQTKLCYHPL